MHYTKRKSAKSDCVINSYIQNNKKNKQNYALPAISTQNEDPGLSSLFWGVVVFRHYVIIAINLLKNTFKGKLRKQIIFLYFFPDV
jgi:hypothetical protein